MGKAKNLKNRVSSYFTNKKHLGSKTSALVSHIEKIKVVLVGSELESLLLEANFIKKYQPKYNIRLTDGKMYPLIKITDKDLIPKVLISRQADDKNSSYFGPYPNSGAMKLVLKTIRKIFPYESALNHPKRICLYNHIGLCPCLEAKNNKELQKKYKKTIKYIKTFLEGNSRKVIKDLEKERGMASQGEDFEKAAGFQKKIDAINLITNPATKPVDYETNPNLISDIRHQELKALKKTLNVYGLNIKKLERIECYDISNTQGHQATGSMVVFTNGEKDSKWYRRFKMRQSGTPNDFAMHQETLNRRLNHNEWPRPDLLVIDGGKGQVSATMKILKDTGLSIPLIGLAKREETIVLPDGKLVQLDKNSPAMLLLRRIRDEAHRFAINYHKKLRSKTFLAS